MPNVHREANLKTLQLCGFTPAGQGTYTSATLQIAVTDLGFGLDPDQFRVVLSTVVRKASAGLLNVNGFARAIRVLSPYWRQAA